MDDDNGEVGDDSTTTGSDGTSLAKLAPLLGRTTKASPNGSVHRSSANSVAVAVVVAVAAAVVAVTISYCLYGIVFFLGVRLLGTVIKRKPVKKQW